jgi:hypothetical protein
MPRQGRMQIAEIGGQPRRIEEAGGNARGRIRLLTRRH